MKNKTAAQQSLIAEHKQVAPLNVSKVENASASGKKIIYIAGKVTGLPPEIVEAKFLAKQIELEAQGYEVLNPVKLVNNAVEQLEVDESVIFPDWLGYMRFLLCYVANADEVYLLPCWNDSKGATIERNLALSIGIPVTYGS